MSRAVAVARVHTLDVQQTIWPWAILATSFVVNVVLWVALRGLDGFEKTTGGLASLYATALFVASVAVARQLPFTLGLGVTRRSFMGGSLLYATASSALAGVVLTLLNRVEEVTDDIEPGGTAQLAVDLQPGTYEMYCAIGNHRELGMDGTVTVDSFYDGVPDLDIGRRAEIAAVPFDEAPNAHRILAARENIGKVVLVP